MSTGNADDSGPTDDALQLALTERNLSRRAFLQYYFPHFFDPRTSVVPPSTLEERCHTLSRVLSEIQKVVAQRSAEAARERCVLSEFRVGRALLSAFRRVDFAVERLLGINRVTLCRVLRYACLGAGARRQHLQASMLVDDEGLDDSPKPSADVMRYLEHAWCDVAIARAAHLRTLHERALERLGVAKGAKFIADCSIFGPLPRAARGDRSAQFSDPFGAPGELERSSVDASFAILLRAVVAVAVVPAILRCGFEKQAEASAQRAAVASALLNTSPALAQRLILTCVATVCAHTLRIRTSSLIRCRSRLRQTDPLRFFQVCCRQARDAPWPAPPKNPALAVSQPLALCSAKSRLRYHCTRIAGLASPALRSFLDFTLPSLLSVLSTFSWPSAMWSDRARTRAAEPSAPSGEPSTSGASRMQLALVMCLDALGEREYDLLAWLRSVRGSGWGSGLSTPRSTCPASDQPRATPAASRVPCALAHWAALRDGLLERCFPVAPLPVGWLDEEHRRLLLVSERAFADTRRALTAKCLAIVADELCDPAAARALSVPLVVH
eukprot:gnl/Spiro4/18586_TR9967_c0_g1_i4.p1 gnl/Spiro4/18586_TR9967_c0_g1~~gnl/Spiro4/18586_TR9967_c0_g1_i4.p1  ORF type:complete len:555 (-),score=103.23 gnl/Spiro4/18586_TR9967_c0_g1_i4:65-1729(-)